MVCKGFFGLQRYVCVIEFWTMCYKNECFFASRFICVCCWYSAQRDLTKLGRFNSGQARNMVDIVDLRMEVFCCLPGCLRNVSLLRYVATRVRKTKSCFRSIKSNCVGCFLCSSVWFQWELVPWGRLWFQLQFSGFELSRKVGLSS